jgi:alkylation response protein AidB-like acyl-CoA dehydrogenase
MDIRLETARLVLYKAAWLKKQGKHPLREAAIAKTYVSEACVQSCLDAIQIHGGYGYMTDYQIERELRDSIAGKIYSGTSEIQKMILAGFHGL